LLNFKSNQSAGKKSRVRGFLKLSLPLVLALAPIGALSDQLVWVLGSFSDAGTAQQVAREVHDLTGQSGYVQTAVVNGRAVYRALIDPGVTDDAQARTGLGGSFVEFQVKSKRGQKVGGQGISKAQPAFGAGFGPNRGA